MSVRYQEDAIHDLIRSAKGFREVRELLTRAGEDDIPYSYWGAVASYTQPVDDELIDWLAEVEHERHAWLLLHNPAATDQHIHQLAHRLIVHLGGASVNVRRHAATTIEALLASERIPGNAEAVRLVIEYADTLSRSELTQKEFDSLTALCSGVLSIPDLSEPDLLQITSIVLRAKIDAFHVAQHPNATTAVFRALVSNDLNLSSIQVLCDRVEARTDPVVRAQLLEYGLNRSVLVLFKLACTASGEEFRELFRALAVRDDKFAARLIRSADPSLKAILQPEDLLPLLTSDLQQVRTDALNALHEIGHPSPDPIFMPHTDSHSVTGRL